jgi:hypothetical protein
MTFITPVEVSPSTTGSFVDVDVSAHIPSGSTGVLLHLVNTSAGTSPRCDVRKNGSTDDRGGFMDADSHSWIAIGVDGSRIFEAYIGSTDIDIYVVGYFGSEAVFFTNAVQKTLGSTGSFLDIDISGDTGGDTAVAAILALRDSSSTRTWVIRKNGSTDSRVKFTRSFTGAMIGVDGSEIFEAQVANTATIFHLLGYMKSGVTMNTNATDISLGGTGSWTDLTALPAGSSGGIIEVISTGVQAYGLRKNGSAENIVKNVEEHTFGFVEADGSLLIEGQISNTSVDFFLVGYFAGSSSPSASLSPSASTSPTPSPSSSLSPSGSASPSSSVSLSASRSLSPSASASPSPQANYGLIIKKPSVNKNVEAITDVKELVFTSARGVLGLHTFTTVNGTTNASGNIDVTASHVIGYIPIVIVTVAAYDGSLIVLPSEWHSYYVAPGSILHEVTESISVKIDATQIRIILHAEDYNHDSFSLSNISGRSYTFKVYYYFNELVETY